MTNTMTTEELYARLIGKPDKVIEVDIDNLCAFKNHPFKVQHDNELNNLIDSIKDVGLLTPIIIRPSDDGKYEVISGHRRLEAYNVLGVEKIKAIVKKLTDDEAIISMVDSNLQREKILPSEKAFAYKMKLDAIKHQGKTSTRVGEKLLSVEEVGKDNNESREQVRRYIKLTNLIPELLDKVDEGAIALSPAVELASLSVEYQRLIYEAMEENDCTPSYAQTIKIRREYNANTLTEDRIFDILSEQKPNQQEHIRFRTDDIRKYFPKNYTDAQMQEQIIKLLDSWQRKRETNSREER